jgi:two-component system OmpR family response regulator
VPWLRYKTFQVVIVDLMFDSSGGLGLCRRLAGDRLIRVIAMGASRDDADVIVALEGGADDYVPRGANPREVLARVRAHARRLEGAGPLMLKAEFSGFTLDLRKRTLVTPKGAQLRISASEGSLLLAFIQSDGRNLSREELRDFISKDGVDVGVRAIDSHVSRLRRKLEAHGGAHLIATVYGFGYRWSRRSADGMDGPGAPARTLSHGAQQVAYR